MSRLMEFFEGDSGPLSMSRLLMFGSFGVASYIMVHLTQTNGMNEGYFSMFLGAFTGTYLVGKGIDANVKNKTTAAGAA